MKSRNQIEPSLNTPDYEDCQERGLRILGRMIARHLLKQRGIDGMASDLQTGELLNQEDNRESLS